MARARSPLAALVLALFAAGLLAPTFVPAPARAPNAASLAIASTGSAAVAAALAAASAPIPAFAQEEEEEGFDVRILAVLGLPLLAVTWALSNVWRVAFRQVVRFSDSTSGTSKVGLKPED
eukprot:CAMPEP_0171092368 /NCGR_PEP_ID=MMETSP0766_2-20121228/35648_1 /TAXON_ID=439317 /ORGANISM="Gambierdiscus australes, Strain CAWD 149" /LENGTH=120 /DNA_ID=CAMNT_0011550589 /DNA_START=77 /DNA_END=439 /DNA_ORIENTATION=-